ncbi:MAG: GumC family protein [Terriglobales bacterium]|jgi:polysaccharide chain length determinant protein (PEP-CTERM system associated)|nr:Wzz/FepE/Etk N-terminal domain-containing protein [Terriglobales bacterium]
MISNRDLSMDDYLAMLRRRLKLILVPALLAPIAGFLVSYAFTPKYTSQARILVEGQKVPEGYVKPVVTEDIVQRIATMQEQVLSRTRLIPMIDRLGLAKGKSADDVIDGIQASLSIEPVVPDVPPGALPGSKPATHKPGQSSDVPGFDVSFTADNPRTAQQICSELTSMMLEQNLQAREQVAQSTTDFLARQVEEAKHNLDQQDAKLAAFKRQYIGQLPGDEESNSKLLSTLNTQLDASTQALNRAQQDKAYTQSLLAQQLAAWKASQSSVNPQTLAQQLSEMQGKLTTLQSRYTDDYPDVIKMKADIAELKRQLAAANAASPKAPDTNDKASSAEPPEIRQMRVQLHQYDDAIAQATREQERTQRQIQTYQSRLSLSPAIEEQYKELTRDNDTAQKFYDDLLSKKSESQMQTDMESRQQGEQMRLLNPAGLPEDPSFPNRLLFAGGGAGAGLGLGFALAIWLEFTDKSIRTEEDAIAVLDLPVMVSIPWIDRNQEDKNLHGKNSVRQKQVANEKETVEV